MASKHHIHIFTDGSVNSKLKVGYGAYIVVDDLNQSVDESPDAVSLRGFNHTSSTKLELQTVLWAINEVVASEGREVSFRVYTDCQNIIGLPGRRERLEGNDYYSSKNKRLNNYELYQEFYQLTSNIQCEFIKVAGHKASRQKDSIDKLFELVDCGSRKALRENLALIT